MVSILAFILGVVAGWYLRRFVDRVVK